MSEYAVAPAQVLKGQPATLTVTFADDNGVTVDPGTVTVTIARADGTVLVTDAATTGAGAAARSYDLAAANTADLDLLSVTWTSAAAGAAAQTVEIVGAWLFTIAEARRFDKAQLADATKYPATDIAAARARILDQFQEICGVAFVPRYKRITLDADRSATLLLPDIEVTRLREVALRVIGSTDFVALTTDEFADVQVTRAGLLKREALGLFDGLFTRAQLGEYQTLNQRRQNVRVAYEYGYALPPDPIRRAALILAVNQLVPSNISERTMSFSDQNGQVYRYATPGVGKSYFGLPLVDSVLEQYREHVTEAG